MSFKSLTTSILYLFILLLTSCFNLFLPGHSDLWFYTFSSGETPAGFSLTPASFLYLDPRKTYTLDFGKFQYGRWERQNDTLVLYSVTGDVRRYSMKYLKGNEMQLGITPGMVSDFSGSPSSFSSPTENPFSLADNQWRIPAKHKETAVAIRERLINHCLFWKTYFSWALNNNIDYVDVRSTPTPIKIYSNGFALKDFDNLPKQWQNYFYDSADCRLANRMIGNIFNKKNIAWAQTDNKYKMFMGAFDQLENFLREENKNQ